MSHKEKAISQTEMELRQQGSRHITGSTQKFLKHYVPFDKMKGDALHLFAENAQLVFHAAGSEIVGPDSGTVRFFYVIESGKVQARQAGEVTVTEYSVRNLGPGESFPIGAATSARPTTNTYTALADTFCYQLPTEDLMRLMAISPEFNIFCTQYIASLLQQSRQQLQQQFAQRASEQQTLNSPLTRIGSRSPISVAPETPLRMALEDMSKAGVGSLIIAGADRKPVGIFTRSDLLDRVFLVDLPNTAPISQAMSPDPFMLEEHATAYDAMLAMATHGIRHVLVTDAEGKLTGVVSERDLFALHRVGLRQIRQAIESAENVESLQRSAADVRQLSFNMLAQGIGAEQLTQFISALNDALTRRVSASFSAEMNWVNCSAPMPWASMLNDSWRTSAADCCSDPMSSADSMAWRIWRRPTRCRANRSRSETTPVNRPSASVTSTCRMPWVAIASIAS